MILPAWESGLALEANDASEIFQKRKSWHAIGCMQITEHHGVVYLRATPCLKLPINARNSRRSWCVAGFIGCWTSVHINADRFYLANILTFLRQDNGLYHSVDEVEFRWTHKRTHLFWTEGISDIVDVAPWSSVRRLRPLHSARHQHEWSPPAVERRQNPEGLNCQGHLFGPHVKGHFQTQRQNPGSFSNTGILLTAGTAF